MKVDAGSIFTMAAMSLLTGNVVCTEPTEMEEVVKRAKEMVRIFKSKGHAVVMCIKALIPDFPAEKWPFFTSSLSLSSPIATSFNNCSVVKVS